MSTLEANPSSFKVQKEKKTFKKCSFHGKIFYFKNFSLWSSPSYRIQTLHSTNTFPYIHPTCTLGLSSKSVVRVSLVGRDRDPKLRLCFLHQNIVPRQKFPGNNKENNSLLFLNNNCLLKSSLLLNERGKILNVEFPAKEYNKKSSFSLFRLSNLIASKIFLNNKVPLKGFLTLFE